MEERLQGNPVSEGIAYAKSYIYIPGTLTKAPDFSQGSGRGKISGIQGIL
ncbi:MAG: hypothetical protein ACLVGL_17675 [Waltera sp.]